MKSQSRVRRPRSQGLPLACAPPHPGATMVLLVMLLLLFLPGSAPGFEATVLVVPGYELVEEAHSVQVTYAADTRIYTLRYAAHNVVRRWDSGSGRSDRVERNISERVEQFVDLAPLEVGVHTVRAVVLETHPAQYESFAVGNDDVVSADDLPAVDPDGPGLALSDEQDAIVAGLPGTLVRFEQGELSNVRALAAAEIEAATEQVDESSEVANEDLIGDPVLVASGMFTTAVTDLDLSVGDLPFLLRRIHRSDLGLCGSLGSSWWLSWDTRIVFGESPNAGSVRSVADSTANSILDSDVASLTSTYAGSRRLVIERLAAVNGQLAQAQATYDALALFKLTYHGDYRQTVIAEIDRQMSIAGRLVAESQAIAGEFGVHLANLVASFGTSETGALGELHRVAAEHRSVAVEYGVEAERASAHSRRNDRFAPGAAGGSGPPDITAPLLREARAAGNNSVIVIDPDGVPHRFVYGIPADTGGGQTYPDGSPNPFPSGTGLVAVDPTSSSLMLTPDGHFVLSQGSGVEWVYGFYGQLLRVEDRNGNRVEFHYDSREQLTRVTDRRGRELLLERNPDGLLTAVRGPEGTTVTYGFTPAGELARVTDPDGDSVGYAYEGQRIIRTTKPDGSSRAYDYQLVRGAHRVATTTDEEGHAEEFDFSLPGRTSHRNPSGIRTVYWFDQRRRLTRIDHEGGAEFPGGLFEQFGYDVSGNMVYSRDVDGSQYRYAYDSRQNLLRVDYPDTTSESWTYGPLSLPVSHTDRRGLITEFRYDTAGNLTQVRHADGSTDTYTHAPPGSVEAGAVVTHRDRRGNTRAYRYDRWGFVSTVTDSLGLVARYENDSLGRVVAAEDGLGNRVTVTYTGGGQIDVVRGPEGRYLDYDYDERKDLTRLNQDGRVSTFVYDDRHLLVEATNALGETLSFGYRPDGLVSWRTRSDPDSESQNSVEFGYDERGQLSRETHAGTHEATRFEYDPRGRVAAVIDGESRRTEFGYSPDGHVVSRTGYVDGTPVIQRHDYYPTGELRRATDPMGRSESWDYDARSRTVTRIDARGSRWTYIHDPYGLVLRSTDPTGRSRFYDHDLRGRLVAIRNDTGIVVEYEYDLANRLISRTDGEGNTTRFRYDGLGRQIAMVNPDGGIRQTHYNTDGSIEIEIDETGIARGYEYDALGRMTARLESDRDGQLTRRTEYSWSFMGVVNSITKPSGQITTFTLDHAGRVAERRNPSGALTVYERDRSGLIVAQIDPTGRRREFEYDGLRRLTEISRGGETDIEYHYDVAGNLRFEYNGVGAPHEYRYDETGLLRSEVDRLGNLREYQYDDAGRRTRIVDFNGVATEIGYDAAGLISEVAYEDGTARSYHYDRSGVMVAAHNQERQLQMAYTDRGLLHTIADAEVAIRYHYDAAGRTTGREDLTLGEHSEYLYDQRGFLVGVDDSLSGYTSLDYDAAGRITRVAAPNGMVTSASYDSDGRIALQVVTRTTPDNAFVDGSAYLYDQAGRRLYDVDHLGRITAYAYDPQGRLSQVRYPFSGPKRLADYVAFAEMGLVPSPPAGQTIGDDFTPGPADAATGGTPYQSSHDISSETQDLIARAYRLIYPLRKAGPVFSEPTWTESFEYDAAGNRLRWSTGWGSVGYTYDSAGRLERAGGTVYDYDMAGNLASVSTAGGTSNYTYTPDNRLATAETDGMFITFGYDALGRRANRMTLPAIGGTSAIGSGADLAKHPDSETVHTSYHYDGLTLRVSARTHSRFPLAGDIATLVRSPIPGAGRYRPAPVSGLSAGLSGETRATYREVTLPPGAVQGGAGRTMAVSSSTGSTYLTHDPLGSVRASTSSSGVDATLYNYDAFGNLLTGSATPQQPYGFNGNPVDAATGLYNYGYRDYSPATGRFTTIDPIRSGSNWYAYADNSPINLIDPTGLAPRNIPEDQRQAYKEHVGLYATTTVTLPTYDTGPREGQEWDCADLATYIASGAMDSATGNENFYRHLTASGVALASIPGIHSSDFGHDGNVTFYRTANGLIDNAFDSANVEAGTIGVFSNHIITVTADRNTPTDPIQTIQGHAKRDVSWDPIADQNSLDSYLGVFIGWAEVSSPLNSDIPVGTAAGSASTKGR